MIDGKFRWIALFFFFLAAWIPAAAQTSQITGQVTDSTGAAVPAAKVSILSHQTGIQRDLTTNSQGYYTAALLPYGVYTVSVSVSGFQTSSRPDVPLQEGQTARLDFSLQVGQISEQIQVVGSAPLLETETPTMSTVVDRQRVVDMPINGRNILSLALLTPGVRAIGEFGGLPVSSYDGSRLSIAGGAATVNNFMVDGIAAENFASGGMQISLSVDATEEFRIITRNPSAEYGRTGGGVVNVISRSGTNEYHGTLYYFHRNKALNANDFFSNAANRPRAPFVFNQYGITVGGPVKKDRTFFFFNWERFHQRTEARAFRTVPTERQRAGDFSQTLDALGRQVAIYDPESTREDPTRAGTFIRQPFQGNVIPQNRLSPVALAASRYYPAPNNPGLANTGVNNFYGQASAPLDKDIYGIKGDHYVTPLRRIAARFTYDNTFRGQPNFYYNIAEPDASSLNFIRNSSVVSYTDSLRPTLLLEARAGLNRYYTPRITRSYGFDVSEINMPAALNTQMQFPMFPRFNLTDVTTIGNGGGDHQVQANNSYSGSAAMTWITGGHTVKFGGEHRLYHANNSQGAGALQFSFNRSFTTGPDRNVTATNAGHGYASFLLGAAASGTANRYQPITYQVRHFALFLQDDWKMTPRFTLSPGLRWEYEGPLTDRFNAISLFDPSIMTTVNGVALRGGVMYPGVDGRSRGNRDASWTDFGPRLGFSWQVRDRTVVRGGYGIYYLPTSGTFVRAGQTGFTITTNMLTSADGGLTPEETISNPFPTGIMEPVGSSGGAVTGLGTSITGNMFNLKRGYSQQWNMNVQREFGNGWLIEIGYMGNRGVSLPANREFSYLPESALALGPALQELVTNPYAGLVSSGPLSAARVQRGVLLQTYPQYLSATGMDSWANSIYHAGTLRVEKRFHNGFSLLGSYTWSKLIDDNVGGGLNAFADSGSNSVQNWNDLRAERAVSTSNMPHRVVVSGTYVIPTPRFESRILRGLVAGWQTNWIFTAQSGNTLSVSTTAPAYTGSRPNMIGDPGVDEPTITRWLDRSAFAQPAQFTYGNAPRNLPSTRSDALVRLDASFFKNIALTERITAQFRAEAFNLANTPTFGNPATGVLNTNFGVVSSLAVNTIPRQLQMALKIYF
ncbi:MAG TPA: TonB-dependent receptor [Bryobacteraceae bacterium]|nr:TonB-dependent receptor [Bryobacteraceae bacterium]